jgi:hypothetical protein
MLTRTEKLEVDIIVFAVFAAAFIIVALFQLWPWLWLAAAFVCLRIVYRRLAYLKWQSDAYAAVDRIYDAATVEKCVDDPLMMAGVEVALLCQRWLQKEHPR